jgi:hypothetical protein
VTRRKAARFDDELSETLARRFPERALPEDPMRVHHRMFADGLPRSAGRAARYGLKGLNCFGRVAWKENG